MVMQLKNTLNMSLRELKEMQSVQQKRISKLSDYEGVVLRERVTAAGRRYYCAYKGKESGLKYLGSSDSEAVNNVKELRFLKESLDRIEADIREIEKMMKKLEDVSYEEVNMSLPSAYRNPKISYMEPKSTKTARWKNKKLSMKAEYGVYMPDELRIRTDNGGFDKTPIDDIINTRVRVPDI